MPRQTWTLSELAPDQQNGDLCITPKDMPGARGSWKVTQRTLRNGLSAGVDLIEIDNGRMRLMVIPTRGMGVWKATIGDETLGWKSPVRGPVHPKFVPLFDPSGFGWLEGFDELIVRCGLESNGAPEFNEQGQLLYPLHGRIANRPAYHVELTVDDSAQTITVRGLVEETRFHFQKLRLEASLTTSFDSTSFTINDQVENFGGAAAEMQMLYHINLGEPLLAPGDQIVAPVHSIRDGVDESPLDSDAPWEHYGPAVSGQPEDCFYLDLLSDANDQTQVLLKNAEGSAGTAIQFNTQSLPCFSLWKNLVAKEDGYVTGLEPATNFPNTRSAEAKQGRVIALAPGETWSTELSLNRLTTSNEVKTVEKAIHSLKNQSV